MKVFVINLDKDTQKLSSIDKQLGRLCVPYERISAVYGKSLPESERRLTYRPFRWWCAVGRPIVPAEIGCALSHYGIYRRMRPGTAVCILEDDVMLAPDFAKRLNEVERFVKADRPQVIMLSSHDGAREGKGIVRGRYALCTDGYVITQPAAQALLKANLPMSVPCDHWWRWERKGLIELYHALPCVVKQDQITFIGTTQRGMKLVKDYPLPKWLWHKLKRLVGKSIDRVIA